MDNLILSNYSFFAFLLSVLLLTIFNAFFILGLKKASEDPYLLASLTSKWRTFLLGKKSRFKIVNKFKDFIFEGTIGCVDCMASFHSLTFLLPIAYKLDISLEITIKMLPLLILYIPVLSAIVDFFDLVRTFLKNSIINR